MKPTILTLSILLAAGCGGVAAADDTEPKETAATTTAPPGRCASSEDCSPDENACYVGVCSVLGRCLFKPGCLP